MLLILLMLVLSCGLASADTIRDALVSLCDPAKIATITAERGANPRVRKICYWLEMARKAGREPSSEMREVLGNRGQCAFSFIFLKTNWWQVDCVWNLREKGQSHILTYF